MNGREEERRGEGGVELYVFIIQAHTQWYIYVNMPQCLFQDFVNLEVITTCTLIYVEMVKGRHF